MLLPLTCAGCGARAVAVCRACAAAMRPAPALPPPPGVDACAAVLAYEGPARELVARLKYRNHRSALDGMAAAMAASLTAVPDVVTWAPTTDARRRERGFDHAELLARRIARRLGRPCRRLLTRAPGPPQTGRSRAERQVGPRLDARARVEGTVLLVDDVVTTGATAEAAAAALRRAGASRVEVVAAARTVPPTPQLHHAP